MTSDTSAPTAADARLGDWGTHSLALIVVACLLALAAANISLRASWREVEDGVLWSQRADGVVAAEIAPDTAAARAGVQPGDLLLAIDGQPVDAVERVAEALHGSQAGRELAYTLMRDGTRELRDVAVLPVPQGNRALYFVLAGVAIFTLLVGASVRLRRPGDAATLHFFWLCVSFFGVFAFSFSGRLDRLDWVFYWADVAATLLLPPLFMHFALVFPERQNPWVKTEIGRRLLPLLYAPVAALGGARILVIGNVIGDGPLASRVLVVLDRLEMLYLGAGLVFGFAVMVRALRRVGSLTGRRQLRWIAWGTALGALPFVAGYVLPYSFGIEPLPKVEWLAIPLGLVPLAFASAVVRYRLMDVEVIIKRGIVYAVAISAIAAIYSVLLKLVTEMFPGAEQHYTVIAMLATLVVVMLGPQVKNAIQTTLDRAHYRERYDYRRALVGFARDLNADLDLESLSVKLTERVRATLGLDRMAVLLSTADGAEWKPLYAEGFLPTADLSLDASTGIGGRLDAGHGVSLIDPFSTRRFTVAEVDVWRDQGVHYLLPCMSKDRAIAVMALGSRDSGEPLNSEDLALLIGLSGQVATAIENGRLYHELRQKADELNRLREFSENIIASLTDGLLVLGLDRRVVRWNPALERLFGITRGAAVGRTVDELFDAAFVEAVQSADPGPNGEVVLYRVPASSRHADARSLLLNVAATPLRTPDGRTAGTIVLLEDTTARVKLEEQLQISERMASLGLLAAGVAHEVNTPLTGISSFTQMLLENADPSDPRTPLLEKIEKQTFRAAKIVNGLLNLARPAQSDLGRIDLHGVIGDVLSLLEHQLRSGSVQLRRDMHADETLVLGIEHKLQQVFLNLFLNARDAMPKGGWLSIVTRNEGDDVVVEVADTGSGIQAEHLGRIYDPFFTTKPIGKGTGLGLSITYGIVQEHDGTITVDSAAGQGTRFVLRFPLARAARHGGRHSQQQA